MADAGGNENQPSMLMRLVNNPTTWSAVLVVVLLVLVGWILWSGTRPIVDQLPDPEFARGIITLVFVLFTIGFAAIVLIHGLFFSDLDKEDRRFTRGREVLGLFIGVVGTIIGFYFGSTEKVAAKLDVAVRAQRQATPSKVGVNIHAVGGTPPYRFVISVGSKKVTDPPLTSSDGWLATQIDGDNAAELTVEASDAKDLRASKKEKIMDFKEVKETKETKDITKEPRK